MTYSIPKNLLERRRLLRLAREYRQKGYSVTLHPSSEELPSALAKCSFDLIAINGSEAIAAEIRTRESLTLNGAADLRRITNLVKQVPGWEFELIVTNPRRKVS
jgi:Holliday junction resolvase